MLGVGVLIAVDERESSSSGRRGSRSKALSAKVDLLDSAVLPGKEGSLDDDGRGKGSEDDRREHAELL